MKKRAAVIIASLFLLSIPTISSAANPVAGAKCSKSGLTQTYKGKKFTCIKSGNKLVWNKGLSVSTRSDVSPTPAPSQAAQSQQNTPELASRFFLGELIKPATPTKQGEELVLQLPVQSNLQITSLTGFLEGQMSQQSLFSKATIQSGNNMSGVWVFKFLLKSDQAVGQYKMTVTAEDSAGKKYITEYDKIEVVKNVVQSTYLSEFNNVVVKSSKLITANWPAAQNKITITYQYSEYFPKKWLELWKAQAESSIRFFSQFIDRPEIFHIYFLTEKDQQMMSEIGLWNENNSPTHFQYWAKNQDLQNCEGAAAWYVIRKNDNSPSLNGGTAIPSNVDSQNLNGECKYNISHESFHAVQDYFLTLKQGNTGFESNDSYDDVEMPIFREGSAETISYVLGQESLQSGFEAFYQRFHDFVLKSEELTKLQSNNDVVNYLKLIEHRSASKDAHDSSYLFGMTFWQSMIAQHGFDKFVDLLKSQNRNETFKAVFTRIYGMPIETAYQEAAPHIYAAIDVLRH